MRALICLLILTCAVIPATASHYLCSTAHGCCTVGGAGDGNCKTADGWSLAIQYDVVMTSGIVSQGGYVTANLLPNPSNNTCSAERVTVANPKATQIMVKVSAKLKGDEYQIDGICTTKNLKCSGVSPYGQQVYITINPNSTFCPAAISRTTVIWAVDSSATTWVETCLYSADSITYLANLVAGPGYYAPADDTLTACVM